VRSILHLAWDDDRGDAQAALDGLQALLDAAELLQKLIGWACRAMGSSPPTRRTKAQLRPVYSEAAGSLRCAAGREARACAREVKETVAISQSQAFELDFTLGFYGQNLTTFA